MSKLRYGVSSVWLSKSDLRRLDGFQAGCLRKMLGIAPSYFSRTSNARVRQIAEHRPFSEQVPESQLKLLGQVLTNPAKHFLRAVAFHGGQSLVPETSAYVRKQGRPKHNWTDQLVLMMKQAAGSLQEWQRATSSYTSWCQVMARLPK